ncbi:MAG TPA: hypothetical protein VGG11_12965 [Xanthobacteraceae bacterium]|jgi:hypothetical protein
MRELHPFHFTRLIFVSAVLVLYKFALPPGGFAQVLPVWIGYVLLFTTVNVWRGGWRGLIAPTGVLAALAYGLGPAHLPFFAATWFCCCLIAFTIQAFRFGVRSLMRRIACWREHRRDRRKTLQPVTIAVRETAQAVRADEVLARFGLKVE